MAVSTGLHASASAQSIEPLRPFWSHVVGAGRANEGLRADWQQHLRQASSACGFRYVRFHGLFHDDMHVYHEAHGKPVYNFQYLDTLFDAMLEMNMRPFVELGFCPSLLATKTATVFWWNGHGSPPKDLQKWSDLVGASVQHWVERYGLGEVQTWYFECWNEYYALYETTVKAVKGISENLRVGGPSTSNYVPDTRFDGELEDIEVQKNLKAIKDIDALQWKPVWVEHFLRWCHARKLPVDFISCHPYPTDWALDANGNESRRVRNVQATPEDLRLIRQVVSASPYPSAEIHLTEWSSSPSSRDHSHDYVPAATYIVRTMLASLNLVDTLAYWTFTDVFEEESIGMTPFRGCPHFQLTIREAAKLTQFLDGGFGLINLQGLPKPTFHAFRLLNWLGDEVLQRDVDHGIITRDSKTGRVSAILFHYPPELQTSPPPAYLDRQIAEDALDIGRHQRKAISIENLSPGAAFRLEILTPGKQGDAVQAWKSLGSPSTIDRQALQHLNDYSSTLSLEIVTANDTGTVVVERELPPWTIIAMIQIQS